MVSTERRGSIMEALLDVWRKISFESILMLDVKLDYGSFGITPAMVDIKNYSKQVL